MPKWNIKITGDNFKAENNVADTADGNSFEPFIFKRSCDSTSLILKAEANISILAACNHFKLM